MLSDEEKKAIEKIKKILYMFPESKELKLLLNLIEKQSKEIEELKEDSCCMTNCVRRDKEKLFLEDKIKAKIEVLEKLQEEFPNNDEIRIKIISYKKLLEKE